MSLGTSEVQVPDTWFYGSPVSPDACPRTVAGTAARGRYNSAVVKPRTKAPGGLLALGSAAMVAVYAVGYARTRAPGVRFVETPALRRPADVARPLPTVEVRPPLPPPHQPVAVPARHAPVDRPSSRPVPLADPTPVPDAPKPEVVSEALPATPVVTPVEPPAVVAKAVTDPGTPTADSKSAGPLRPKEWYQDGTFSGWGTSRHGDIQATVVIADGRITSATITQCLTRYSCSLIDHLPGQVVTRQSPNVDFVSGATESANAFYYAILDALTKAK